MLIERVTNQANYLLRLPAAKPTDEAVLFLHGFPANKLIKNLDLALHTQATLHRDVYHTHYRGVGESSGRFLFTSSVEDTANLVKWMYEIKGYKKIDIVGHSWGGLVAVNCALSHPDYINSIVLVSPFCNLEPEEEALHEWFIEGVRSDCPGIFGSADRSTVKADFDKILSFHLPLKRAADLTGKTKIGIIQSKHDEVTPAATTKLFAAQLTPPPIYLELEQDHSFSQNRLEIGNHINRLLLEFK